ncbi:MAG: hypothetical protein JRF29_00645 [Deltaproteobacteria bacterium]|jgi:hypothetical protein|nr:hypothetical protein [Deltaproteobacteria bacterium]
MASAILMAGYKNKMEVRHYAKIVGEHYGEKFIETGYRPLREFETVIDGQKNSKPIIQFTLEKLFASDLIDDIIIVGHQMLLEQRLGNFIKQFEKPCRFINQNTRLSADIIERFKIKKRKVRYSSIAGNLIKGYAVSKAYREKKHALFVASDSPLTTQEFIEHFLNMASKHQDQAAIILPAILIDAQKDKMGRHPLKLLNDTEFELPGSKDSHNRQGFRLSSLMFANPHLFDMNTANTAYSLRKALNPNAQLALFKITRNLGYPNVYSKYFVRKDLSIKEVENITSAYFKGRLKLIPMSDEKSTYDYDGTDFEYQMLTKMLNSS